MLPATDAVAELIEQGEPVLFCPQNIAEFWNVATRPVGVNGLGMSHGEVLTEIARIEELLTLLPDVPGIYARWKQIVKEHKVQGAKVYDARLTAVASVYGVGDILTFNTADFKRYDEISAIDPLSLLDQG